MAEPLQLAAAAVEAAAAGGGASSIGGAVGPSYASFATIDLAAGRLVSSWGANISLGNVTSSSSMLVGLLTQASLAVDRMLCRLS